METEVLTDAGRATIEGMVRELNELHAECDALKACLAETKARAEADAGAIEWLQAECDALRARLAEVEAQAAAMREVLQDALPAEESGWWCPTCKCEVPDVEVTFEGYHDACGTYIEIVNSGAWRERARAAVASDAGRETIERLEQLEAQVVAMRQALAEAIRGLELVHPMDLAEPCAVYGVWQQCKAALSSNAGRETAERLRLLEELAEAATAFTERCTLGECHSRDGEPMCDEDPCLVERLKAIVRKLKGGDADAGTGSC